MYAVIKDYDGKKILFIANTKERLKYGISCEALIECRRYKTTIYKQGENSNDYIELTEKQINKASELLTFREILIALKGDKGCWKHITEQEARKILNIKEKE